MFGPHPRGFLAHLIEIHAELVAERWHQVAITIQSGRDRGVAEPGLDLGHGVYEFVERHPTDPGKRIPVSSRSIKAPTFFERCLMRDARSANDGTGTARITSGLWFHRGLYELQERISRDNYDQTGPTHFGSQPERRGFKSRSCNHQD
jgi:hypothetical protein